MYVERNSTVLHLGRTQLSETEGRECLNKCPLCDMWFLFENDVSCHTYVEQCCIWGGPSQLSDTEGRECCRATGRSPCSCQPSQYPPHMNMDGYGCQPSQYPPVDMNMDVLWIYSWLDITLEWIYVMNMEQLCSGPGHIWRALYVDQAEVREAIIWQLT